MLSALLRQPNLQRAELAEILDIDGDTFHALIMDLCERRLMRLGEPEATASGGKSSPKLLLNARYCCSIGIAVHTDHACVALMDFAGGVWTRFLCISGQGRDDTLSSIDGEITSLLLETGFARDHIFGLGFCLDGQVLDRTSFSAHPALKQWSKVHVGPLLSQWYDLPIWTETAAHAAALCEARFGAGRKLDTFVHLSIGRSLACGLVVDGSLTRGAFGNAGVLDSLLNTGDATSEPSLHGLLANLKQHGASVDDLGAVTEGINLRTPGVSQWLDQSAPSLHRILSVLTGVVDPKAIVLGGRIRKNLAKALVKRTQSLGPIAGRDKQHAPGLLVTEMPPEAAAIGAAGVPLERVFFSPST
ncbi:ROK family protein [Cohaesibacter sp. ES.047]|uniref:ROK family protein n=1 Tax=Cohaesibacter sp. ES.047 TaxID=1798205 RepID=UPI0012FE05EF|nr:ROK family protein [Cohaesibacter sp. ES.047]